VVNKVWIPVQSPEKKSLIPFHTDTAVFWIASHAWDRKAEIACQHWIAVSFTLSHRLIQNCRNSSFVFHR
jgi:hypothetical protein